MHESDDDDNGYDDRAGRELWRRGHKKTWLYRNIRERRSWRAALEAAMRMPSIAYSAATLAAMSQDVVRELEQCGWSPSLQTPAPAIQLFDPVLCSLQMPNARLKAQPQGRTKGQNKPAHLNLRLACQHRRQVDCSNASA